MPETTENYHRIPVSDGHDSHDIKTITISNEQGIKALYCVDCKEVITYLFDVDKWTMSEAQEWVDEHESDDKDASMKLDRRTKDFINSQVRYKSFGSLKVKSIDDEDGVMLVRGYFTDDKRDEVGDTITRGATEKAINSWRKWGNIRTMHDYPSGRVEAIGEEDGLDWNEIVTVPVDKGTIDLLKGGVLKAYSVGIIPRKYELDEELLEESDDPWFFPLIIHEYDMIEISYVDHPANYSATISDISEAKSSDGKAIIFKRMPGDNEDGVMDKSSDESQEGFVPEEELLTEEEMDEYLDSSSVDDEDFEEIEDSMEEDGDENTVELGFGDVLLAVDSIKSELAEVHNFLTESLPSIISNSVESALSTGVTQEENTEVDSDVEEDKSLKSLEEIKDEIVKGVVDALRESNVTRKASITVEEEIEEKPAEEEDPETMSKDRRRQKMKEIINKGKGV